jgi:UDP-N-acetylglucosamine diphosphorylase / glucose-1-phosphate thymidylyltransferase / UDP-N-acetylgalactosamine diphosphorylase / glucosamine-1-phosphate N-acetyltransferase / galactosamine-1-phosphate N-acetyltransferase
VHISGDHHVSLGQDAHIEPGVVIDTREGPVRLEAGAYVEAPARLIGPLYVGVGSRLFGGRIGRSSIGPACKVKGEVEASVLTGYCNKAHDGYLGHALLGRWVNLGAHTTNSDLKNNYGPVRVRLGADEEVDTGLLKVGCFLGDHVRTGIGTLITTGAVIGAGTNLIGDDSLPRYVPPFSWGRPGALEDYALERFLSTADTVMRRRGLRLTDGLRAVLSRAWEATRAERT